MSIKGFVFANLHDSNIPELTSMRTMASVPFCCRYRLIDFALSNMVNSGITNISVITNQNYQSLMDHLGSGKDWDLARRSGGLKIIPPFMNAYANNKGSTVPRSSRLETLKSISSMIYEMTSDYVVLCDCDSICNIDIAAMVDQHEKTGADITIAVKRMNVTPEKASKSIIVTSDENGRIVDVLVRPDSETGNFDVNINVWVITRRYFQSMIREACARDYHSLSIDVLARECGNAKFMVYRYEGYYECISSMEEYFSCSMRLLTDRDAKNSLFDVKKRPIYTKVRNSPPAKHCGNSRVSNSLIADGCVIEGTVENSILFRGVHVGKNTVVRNSILFQDTFVGDSVKLNCVVTDKEVVIRDMRELSGHESMPFYIEKGKMV